MSLSLIALHYESTAPASRPQLPRKAGATAGSRSVIVPFMRSEFDTPSVIIR
jgi:hypothetical protein